MNGLLQELRSRELFRVATRLMSWRRARHTALHGGNRTTNSSRILESRELRQLHCIPWPTRIYQRRKRWSARAGSRNRIKPVRMSIFELKRLPPGKLCNLQIMLMIWRLLDQSESTRPAFMSTIRTPLHTCCHHSFRNLTNPSRATHEGFQWSQKLTSLCMSATRTQ